MRRRQLRGFAAALVLLTFFITAPLWGPAASLSAFEGIVIFLILALVADWFFLYVNGPVPGVESSWVVSSGGASSIAPIVDTHYIEPAARGNLELDNKPGRREVIVQVIGDHPKPRA